MNTLAKLYKNDDEELIPPEDRKWCLVVVEAGSDALFCSGEVFGYGEGGAEAKIKTTARGGITCLKCLDKIKEIKAVKL